MTTSPHLSPEAEAWLTDVSRRLSVLDPPVRHGIVDGFRAHLADTAETDASLHAALSGLGTPKQAARQVLDEQKELTGQDPERYRWGAKRIVQVITLTLTVAAVLALLILPSYTSVSEDSAGHQKIETLPLLSVVGLWYLLVLALPVVFAAAPLIPRHRGWQMVSIISTVLLVAFAALGSLSIGFYFIPAGIMAIIASCLRPRALVFGKS